MNSAEKIIEQAIREDKGVDICLSVNTFLNGFVPVHVTFTKAKHNPFTSETKHHAESEIELVVDNKGKKKSPGCVINRKRSLKSGASMKTAECMSLRDALIMLSWMW